MTAAHGVEGTAGGPARGGQGASRARACAWQRVRQPGRGRSRGSARVPGARAAWHEVTVPPAIRRLRTRWLVATGRSSLGRGLSRRERPGAAGRSFGAEVSGHSVATPFHDMTTLQN